MHVSVSLTLHTGQTKGMNAELDSMSLWHKAPLNIRADLQIVCSIGMRGSSFSSSCFAPGELHASQGHLHDKVLPFDKTP